MYTEILNEQLLSNNGLIFQGATIFQGIAMDVFTSVLVMTGLVKSIGGHKGESGTGRGNTDSRRMLCVQLNPEGYTSTYRAKVNALRSVFSVGQIISSNRR